MPGPPPKAAARRQRSRRDMGNDIGALSKPGKAPSLPKGLCPQAQTAWTGYWRDAVSGVMRSSDAPIVLRWVKNLDRYHRLVGEADSAPIVPGSKDQPKANPLYDLILKLEASIRTDEQQLGIGPLNRLRLGVAMTESAKTLADLRAEAEADAENDDPRTTLITLAGRRS